MGKHGFGVGKASLSPLSFFLEKRVCVWPPGFGKGMEGGVGGRT